MYETSFGLKRRPFAATPDATCFLSAGPIQAAFDEIVVCVEQGQGIAVLTAPAGIGKTLLCERLCSELSNRFQTVFLRHSSFLTRRALLQTLLCELNHSYQQPSEQELRLELFPAIRALRPQREALVVICDESHHLPETLIEELRILTDFAESGRPLVRLVLVGQLSLEEKLAQPSLEAFNQRIRAHVNLPTFDRAGSLDYIDYRLTWGGGRTDEIFTLDALDVIARASDGIPRCINQLADHSLLLAFVAEQRPVGEEIVLEALNDLRQLPLHWNESSLSRSSLSTSECFVDEDDSVIEPRISSHDSPPMDSNLRGAMFSYESTVEEIVSDTPPLEDTPFETGADVFPLEETTSLTTETFDSSNAIRIDVGSDDWRQTVNLFSPSRSGEHFETSSYQSENIVESPVVSHSEEGGQSEGLNRCSTIVTDSQLLASETTNGFHEEVVIDRYASIDAGLPPVAILVSDTSKIAEVRAATATAENPLNSAMLVCSSCNQDDFSDLDDEVESLQQQSPVGVTEAVEPLDQVLEVVRDLIEIVSDQKSVRGTQMIDSPHPSSRPMGIFDSESDSILKSLRREVGDQVTDSETDSGYGQSTPSNETAWEAIETDPVESTKKPRPFRYLFSMLRRKQQQTNGL